MITKKRNPVKKVHFRKIRCKKTITSVTDLGSTAQSRLERSWEGDKPKPFSFSQGLWKTDCIIIVALGNYTQNRTAAPPGPDGAAGPLPIHAARLQGPVETGRSSEKTRATPTPSSSPSENGVLTTRTDTLLPVTPSLVPSPWKRTLQVTSSARTVNM